MAIILCYWIHLLAEKQFKLPLKSVRGIMSIRKHRAKYGNTPAHSKTLFYAFTIKNNKFLFL